MLRRSFGTPGLVIMGTMVLAITGCASRFVAVRALEDAIVDFQQGQFKAACHGASLAKDPSAEIFAKSTYNLSLGAPTGAIPIAISGGAGLEESSKIIVKYNLEEPLKKLTPGSAECKKLLEPATKGNMKIFSPETGRTEERKAPDKILLYDREKGVVVEETPAKIMP
jgi:hypothetical protein